MQTIFAAASSASLGTGTGAPLSSSQSLETRRTVAVGSGSGSATGGVRTENWACGPVTGASWGPRPWGPAGWVGLVEPQSPWPLACDPAWTSSWAAVAGQWEPQLGRVIAADNAPAAGSGSCAGDPGQSSGGLRTLREVQWGQDHPGPPAGLPPHQTLHAETGSRHPQGPAPAEGAATQLGQWWQPQSQGEPAGALGPQLRGTGPQGQSAAPPLAVRSPLPQSQSPEVGQLQGRGRQQ